VSFIEIAAGRTLSFGMAAAVTGLLGYFLSRCGSGVWRVVERVISQIARLRQLRRSRQE
jgi:hypothetical protein